MGVVSNSLYPSRTLWILNLRGRGGGWSENSDIILNEKGSEKDSDEDTEEE